MIQKGTRMRFFQSMGCWEAILSSFEVLLVLMGRAFAPNVGLLDNVEWLLREKWWCTNVVLRV
jgi:hypothetical protein